MLYKYILFFLKIIQINIYVLCIVFVLKGYTFCMPYFCRENFMFFQVVCV